MSSRRVRFSLWLSVSSLFVLASCMVPKPQHGGTGSMTLGGSSSPTVVTTTGPENPRTPTATTVEKTITREYTPTAPQTPTPGAAAAAAANPAVPYGSAGPGVISAPTLVREVVVERATTQLGSSWEDKARELGVKLANMRGVMWVGVLLLVVGPVVGFKMGWMTNGLIAGGVGLLLIILAQVVPGNEAWFGLGGLMLIPLVAYAWYHGHHTATADLFPSPPGGSTSK